MKKYLLLLLPFLLIAAAPSINDMGVQQAVNLLRYSAPAIALGYAPNVTGVTKFGGNPDIDTGSAEVLWHVGGAFTVPTAARTLSVVSTDATDTSAGTGANQILIYGLDENYDQTTEFVTLNGLTPVVTTKTYFFVNRAVVYSSGTGKKNAGSITFTQTTSGTVLGSIPAGNSSTEQLLYQVPRNYRGYFKDLRVSAAKISGGGGSPRITFEVVVYSFVTNTEYVVRTIVLDTSVQNTFDITDFKLEQVSQKEIIYVRATTDINNTVAYGTMSGYMQEM